MRTPVAVALLVVLTAASTGCGAEKASPADETPVAETASPTPVALGDAPLVELTGEEICAALGVDAATRAIGSEVSQAEASSSQTPQCTYTYGGDSATLATFTVAAQRPDDVGDRGLQDAFDHVLEVNRGLAEGSDLEEADVDAGDRAVRLTGSTLTLTVVASAGHLLTIITTPDLDLSAVESLAAAAAEAVAD